MTRVQRREEKEKTLTSEVQPSESPRWWGALISLDSRPQATPDREGEPPTGHKVVEWVVAQPQTDLRVEDVLRHLEAPTYRVEGLLQVEVDVKVPAPEESPVENWAGTPRDCRHRQEFKGV